MTDSLVIIKVPFCSVLSSEGKNCIRQVQDNYLAHVIEQPIFRIPNIYNEIFVLIFLMILSKVGD